jgi:hypothetical protein
MTEQSESTTPSQGDGQEADASEAPTTGWVPHTAAGAARQESPAYSAGPSSEHPEVMIGAAFAGGLLAAMILKRIAR